MTKSGYTHILIPKSFHSQIKVEAEKNEISIWRYIDNLIHSDSLAVGRKTLWGLVPSQNKKSVLISKFQYLTTSTSLGQDSDNRKDY